MEYSAVYKRGRRISSKFFTVFYLENSLDFHRCGITASRKFSTKAVDRNKAKRILREAIRLNAHVFDSSNLKLDLVLNVKSKLAECKSYEASCDLQKLLKQVLN